MSAPNLPPGLPPIPDSVKFAAALGQFSRSMQRFSSLQEQTSTRLTKVIRMGMVALAILFVAMFLMLMTLAQRINLMVDNVGAINTHFHNMMPDISLMHGSMMRMQQNVASIEGIPANMQQMLGHTAQLQLTMAGIRQHMEQLNQETARIAGQSGLLLSHMQGMDQSMSIMEGDLRQTARPMRLFNRMMPGR